MPPCADEQSNEKSSVSCWAPFDRVYCITLQERPDRLEKVRQEFARVGLAGKVEFVPVNRHPTDREQGIFESHQLCLQKGVSTGADRILIFEDDIFFDRFSPQRLQKSLEGLQNESWDGFLLGGMTKGSRKTAFPYLVNIRYRCLAHAYSVTGDYARRLLALSWKGVPWDSALKMTDACWYALYPMCAFQGREGTENQTVKINCLRNTFGGLPFLQRLNELYENHKFFMIGLTVAAVLVFLLWILQ